MACEGSSIFTNKLTSLTKIKKDSSLQIQPFNFSYLDTGKKNQSI